MGSGLLGSWLSEVLRDSENVSNFNLRASAIRFVCVLWRYFPNNISDHEEIASMILTSMQRSTRVKNRPIVVETLTNLFWLLENFTKERDKYASQVFKSLTFSLIEIWEDGTIREFMLRNFDTIMTNNQDLPVSILMEPIAKQINNLDLHSFAFNLYDFVFLENMCAHPKMTPKLAYTMVEALAKV